MMLLVDSEFRSICEEILDADRTEAAWSEVESDDMFQTARYVGGFDATEQAFCFSYTNPEQEEFWFQVSLEEVEEICLGTVKIVETRPSET